MSKEHYRLYNEYVEYSEDEMKARSEAFYQLIKKRRTVRQFSERPVDRQIIENCLMSAGTAPSGANKQPWRFVVVSDPDIKKKIRQAAEQVEDKFYNERAPEYWLEDLRPLGTNEHKPYLEKAPYIIVIFQVKQGVQADGSVDKHYYLGESVGIATGMLITALHNAGLVTLTHTPKPMAFLREVLNRPKEESPFMMVIAGYPEKDTKVPDLGKKPLDEIAIFL